MIPKKQEVSLIVLVLYGVIIGFFIGLRAAAWETDRPPCVKRTVMVCE